MKNTNILIVIVLIGVVLGSFFLLSQKENQNTDEQKVTEKINEETSSSLIDTSDWKTCRNEEYGYEFKYPRKWYMYSMFNGPGGFVEKKESICDGPTAVFLLQKNKNDNEFVFKIHRQIYNWNQTLKEYFNIINKELYPVNNPKLITNSKIDFFRYERLLRYPEAIFLNKKTLFLLSSNLKDKETVKIFDTILSTFRFID